ncbi:5-oxoprolinase subunit PxpB [Bacillus luteolus]|uniref:5-oxoprolinase subunit PxpB n=1 Tax=Litchfieldia luteola TaxID=682179 RepID=A0ABR9QGV7_9BACI|nr:5-oxoprolinase subunit PxpB [Cytobacillus luteolus]MBE4907708.1 5-oxoprolinase subunit PxpB [Cytobacillus luteolus]MBP1944056.1 inhibitor of KinA [Cytobacillus luteolus]
MEFSIRPLGDKAIQILFISPISEKLNRHIQHTANAIKSKHILGIIEVVPAFETLTVYYEPMKISHTALVEKLHSICSAPSNKNRVYQKEIVTIPVCYGNRFGEDLPHVAKHNNLTEQEVVSLHCSKQYLVYLIGFLPGFPYLKGLSQKLHTPRLAEPRLKVPRGSVGIGGDQTGVYPIESPGGWNLIGQTPLTLFNPTSPSPFLIKAGDFIRFVSISETEFYEITQAVKENKYVVKREVIQNEED